MSLLISLNSTGFGLDKAAEYKLIIPFRFMYPLQECFVVIPFDSEHSKHCTLSAFRSYQWQLVCSRMRLYACPIIVITSIHAAPRSNLPGLLEIINVGCCSAVHVSALEEKKKKKRILVLQWEPIECEFSR